EKRDTSRSKSSQGHAWAAYLDHVLRTTMAGVGLWIDSSEQTPEETVEHILGGLTEGLVNRAAAS
ncbi:MAG: phosphotransferase, partial [Ktedonobacteraceae bacterium]